MKFTNEELLALSSCIIEKMNSYYSAVKACGDIPEAKKAIDNECKFLEELNNKVLSFYVERS